MWIYTNIPRYICDVHIGTFTFPSLQSFSLEEIKLTLKTAFLLSVLS